MPTNLLTMQYSLEWLLSQQQTGKRPKYLFFWGHQPSRDGSVTASCFSQWWDGHPFSFEGQIYSTAEHWMMAEKARLFNDEEMLQEILQSKSPGEAKKLGRKVKGFDQETWLAHRMNIVIQGNLHKFGQHEELKAYLLSTKDRIIVEASPRDRIWGIGMGKSNEKATNPSQWRGLNLLGFALMGVRDMLREDK